MRESTVERGSAVTSPLVLVVGSLVWAGVGWAIALWPVDSSSEPVLIASAIGFPALAVAGAGLANRGHYGWAAVVLFMSIGTPTYFAWPLLFVPVALGGIALQLRREERHGTSR